MLKKRFFIKSFVDGEVAEERLDKPFSAARLENFISDEESTYFRPGFELLFPTYNQEKARLIALSDNKLLECTENSIRIIENGALKIEKELRIKKIQDNFITTEINHELNVGDEIYLISDEKKENAANIELIYRVKRVSSQISFEVENNIPNSTSIVRVIKKISCSNLKIKSYTILDQKIFISCEKKLFEYENDILQEKRISSLSSDFKPEILSYYENRFIVASKNKIHFSKVDNPYDFNFSSSSDPSGAMMYEFNFGKKEEIVFCNPSLRSLVIGTNCNIYMAVSTEGFLAPGKVFFKKISSYGAEMAEPASLDDNLIYIEKGGRTIRMLAYVNDDNVYNFNLTKYAKHYKNLKKIIHYKADMLSILSEDGYILNAIIRKDEFGILYGSFSRIVRGKGKFQDIVNDSDILYAIVERNEKYFIERLCENLETDEFNFATEEKYLENLKRKQQEIILMDSALKFNGYRKINLEIKNDTLTIEENFLFKVGDYIKIGNSKLQISEIISEKSIKFFSEEKIPEGEYQDFCYCPKEITNLDYLEDEKISILADGGVLEERVVKNGKIKLDEEITNGIFGIKYEGLLATQPLILSSLDLFSNKNIGKVCLRVKNSRNFLAGFSLYDMQEISFTGDNFKNDEPVPLYTGDIDLNLKNSSWHSYIRLYIKNETPTPLNIFGFYYETNIIQ
jgi:hypothetical protein